MHDQLTYLAEVSRRPNVTIQVIPYSAGGHTGQVRNAHGELDTKYRRL